MIRKAAIKAFLNRPRRDFRRHKKLPPEVVERNQRYLPIRPPIWNKLGLHQKICLLIAAEEKRFAFLLATGMGKTLLSIAIQRYFRKQGSLTKRALVLVPNKVNKYEWAREIEKHSPHTSYCVLQGSTARKWRDMEDSDSHIIIETYAGLIRMLCTPKKTKKGKVRLKPSVTLVKRFQKQIDMLLLDESTLVKSQGKLPARICKKFSATVQFVFALTGTPFGRDPTDLWSQLFIVDRGETLGETLGLYRAAFFTEKKNYWGGFVYTFKKNMEGTLNKILANRTVTFEPDEGDLPKLVSIVKTVRLPEDAQTYYQRAKDALVAAHGNLVESKNAFIRMRQISSGFIGYKNDETGSKAEFEFKPNPKLDSLLATIETIPDQYKIIVFHDFVYSGMMISRELTRMGIGHLRLYGATDDHERVLREFDRNAKKQVLVLNSAAGGFGLNLQIARYGLFFEVPLSVIMGKQTLKRFHRQYSEHDRVFRYDYVVQGTYDQKILDNHKQGKALFEGIIHGREKT